MLNSYKELKTLARYPKKNKKKKKRLIQELHFPSTLRIQEPVKNLSFVSFPLPGFYSSILSYHVLVIFKQKHYFMLNFLFILKAYYHSKYL